MIKMLKNLQMQRTKLSLILFLALILTMMLTVRVLAADTTITLQLNNPNMTINGTNRPIDEVGTTPTTINGRTMLPLRAIAESLGLTVDWNAESQTITLRSADANSDNIQPGEPTTDEPVNGGKILVAYFSATNNTEGIANHIAAALGADTYEIIPETPYTSEDLNYGNSSSRTSIEMNDPAARPAISGSLANMADYDVVFLGYPIWWGQAPKIICTFLESYDLNGKIIVPFCTSSSSDIGSSATNLHSLADEATWLEGHRFSGGTTQTEVANWANSLNLMSNANR